MRPSTLPALALGLAAAATPAQAQTPLTTRLAASGLTRPVFVTAPAGDARLFVVEKGGMVKIVANGQVLPTPFLDLSGTVSGQSEQGLLGLAFDPLYAQNGYFYVDYTTGSQAGMSVVSRYHVSSDPDVADAGSAAEVIQLVQPYTNHNAGMLTFDTTGMLLLGFGDGGSSNDPNCMAQDLSSYFGKILRVDVSGGLPYTIPADNPFVGVSGALPEILHYGVRNPWRWSVDPATGDLYIGDVGQNQREEISFAAFQDYGKNFGWKVMEGFRCNLTTNCPVSQPACGDPVYTDPIYELVHGGAGGPQAIIGGYVYRGTAIPDLVGTYFFSDYNDDKIRTFRYDPVNGVQDFMDRTAELDPGNGLSIRSISSFGEDGFGELYLCDDNDGEIFEVVPDEVLTVTGVTPDPLDAVVPGTAQVVTVTGSGFSSGSTVTLDGVPVDASSATIVSSSMLTFDPPQATQLGPVDLTVTDGTQSVTTSVTIQAPPLPALQVGDGNVPTLISQAAGADVLVGGEPGRMQVVLYSSSNLPSTLPQLSLDIGNNFSDLFLVQVFVIPAQGWDSVNLPVSNALFRTFYVQGVELGLGQGFEVSNLQIVVVGS